MAWLEDTADMTDVDYLCVDGTGCIIYYIVRFVCFDWESVSGEISKKCVSDIDGHMQSVVRYSDSEA